MSESVSEKKDESDFSETVIPSSAGDQNADPAETREIASADRRPDRSWLPDELKHSQLGDYLLEREIGRGGMGIVFKATELTLQRSVAVKVLLNASKLDRMQALRFANESRAAAQLNHPNIVPVYGVGEDDGVHYYVMRLVSGRNLNQVIKTIRYELDIQPNAKSAATPDHRKATTAKIAGSAQPESSSGRRSESRQSKDVELSATDFRLSPTQKKYSSTRRVADNVARIGVKVADALQHAHDAGVIHRDIKPCNLILDDSGDIWVADFGLAQIRDAPTLTQTGVLLGTLRYMSPEQAVGNRAMVDHRTDIYSLGVTLCELLTLKRVIDGKTTQEILRAVTLGAPVAIRRRDPRVPADLATIVEKAMSRDPLDRYVTAGEMSDDLMRFLNNEPIRASRPPMWKRCRQWMARHRAIAATLIVAFLATFVVTAVAAAVVFEALVGERIQLEKTEAALTESEGLRLLSNAALVLPKNPALSLALAARGAVTAPGLEASTTLQKAWDDNHEYATAYYDKMSPGHVAISPDGTMVVSCDSERNFGKGAFPAILHRMNDGATTHELNNGECITSAAFSPSGQYVVTTSAPRHYVAVSEDGDLSRPPVVWDVQSGKKIRTVADTMIQRVHEGTFDPLGTRIVLCQNNSAVVYNYVTNQKEMFLRGHEGKVTYCEFSPDGRRLATLSNDNTIRIWDSSSGRESQAAIPCRTRKGHQVTLGFTAESNALAVCDLNGVSLVKIAGEDEGLQGQLLTVRHFQFAISRHQPLIALIDNVSFRVQIVNSHTLSPICELQLPGRVADVAFPLRNRHAVVACGDKMFLFDTESGQERGTLLGHTESVSHVAFGPNGDKLASVSLDRTMRLWHAKSGAERSAFSPASSDQNSTYALPTSVLSNDDKRLAVTLPASYSTVLYGADGKLLPGEFAGRTGTEFSCNTTKLATRISRTIVVTESSTSRELYRSKFATRVLEGRIVSPDQNKLFVRTETDSFLIDLNNRSRTRLGSSTESIKSVAVSKDLRTIVAGTSNGRCLVVNTDTGAHLRVRKMEFSVHSVDINADGSRYVATDSEGNVQTANCFDDEVVSTFKVPPGDQTRFIGDAARVVNWSQVKPRQIQCREAATGDVVGEISQDSRIRVSCHPELPIVAVASEQGTQIWNVTTNQKNLVTSNPSQSVAAGKKHLAIVAKGDTAELDKSQRVNLKQLLVYSFEQKKILHEESLTANPVSLRVDPETERFVMTQKSFEAAVYDFQSGEFLHNTPAQTSPIFLTAFLNANSVLTLSENLVVRICDNNGQLLTEFLLVGGQPTAVGVTPDSRLLLTADETGDISVWDTREGTEVHHLSGHTTPVRAFSFDRSGNQFCSISESDLVHLWDLRLPKPRTIDIKNAALAKLSPDGNQLLIIRRTNTKDVPLLLNLADDSRQELPEHSKILQAKFLNDGSTIGLLSADGNIELIDTRAIGQGRRRYFVGKSARDFQFTENRLIAVWHTSKLAVWETTSGSKILEYQVARSPLRNAGLGSWRPVTADGKYFTINNGSVRRVPANPLEAFGSNLNRSITEAERQQFRLDLVEDLKPQEH